MQTPTKQPYPSPQGGHAPADVREAFVEAVELLARSPIGARPPVADLRGEQVPLASLCGSLWNCTDMLPGHIVADLDGLGFSGSGTYGSAARWLRLIYLPRGS